MKTLGLIAIFLGLALIVAGVASRALGLGTGQDFLFFQLFGVSRKVLSRAGLILAATGAVGLVLARFGVVVRLKRSKFNASLPRRLASFVRESSCDAVHAFLANARESCRLAGPFAWRRELSVLALNLLSLVSFCAITFAANQSRLFHGLDGAYMMTLGKQQHMWMQVLPGLTNNFFQSLGNIWIPINTWLIPAYSLSMDSHRDVNVVIAFMVHAIEIFLAIYAFSRIVVSDRVIGLMAAWGFVMLTLPLSGYPAIYAIFGLAPYLLTLSAISLFSLSLYSMSGRGGLANALACALAIAGLLAWIVLASPMLIVVLAPAIGLFGLSLLLATADRRERKRQVLVAVAVVVLLCAIGLPMMIAGIYKYTAAYYFPLELVNTRQTLRFASILFHDSTYGGLAGRVLFLMALCGGMVGTWVGTGRVRTVSIAMLSYMALLIVVGAILVVADFWRGPSPIYFEFFIWPVYAVLASLFLRVAVGSIIDVIKKRLGQPKSRAGLAALSGVTRFGWAGLALVPWIVLLAIEHGRVAYARDFPYPPTATPLTSYLQREVGLAVGGTFRGRVLTLSGLGIPQAVGWGELHGVDHELIRNFGNDYRTIGLWYFDIPTLFEYNQAITPALYLIATRFLVRDGDTQWRSVLVMRSAPLNLLRLLGIRYVIADAPVEGTLFQRMRLDGKDGRAVYLYEIDGVNVGDYSPTRHTTLVQALDVVTAMSRADFDGRTQVFTDAALPDGLVAASDVRMITGRGGIRVTARSSGRSILVLPLEFSRCLDVASVESPSGNPRLFRANLVQTGVEFSGSLDATISYYTGPLRNTTCRLEDASDIEKLGIRAVPNRSFSADHLAGAPNRAR